MAAVVDLAVWDLARHAAAVGSGELMDVIVLCPGFVGQRSGGTSASTLEGLAALRDDPELGTWLGPFWYESLQTRVVRRTNALLGYAYAREFRYREAAALGNGHHAVRGRLRTIRQIGWVPLLLNPRTGRFVEAAMRRTAPASGSGPEESKEFALGGTIIAHPSSGAVHLEHVRAHLGGYHATSLIMTRWRWPC